MQELQPYKKEDLTEVLALFRLNVPEYFAAHEEADLQEYLAKHGNTHFVMKEQERIIGTGGYVAKGDTHMLAWYFVHPDYYGKGIGTAIAQHCLNILHTLSQDKIVVRTSQLAYKFFERLGFTLTHTEDNYWGDGLHLYYMVYKK